MNANETGQGRIDGSRPRAQAHLRKHLPRLKRRMLCGGALLLGLFAQAGCTTIPSAAMRRQTADEVAAARDWARSTIAAPGFELTTYAPQRITPDEILTIYIEGDGLAWLSTDTPSSDPTPRDPLALRLALAQPSGNAAYLARPCQFAGIDSPRCSQRYWTRARFAAEVIEAMDAGVTQLKSRFGARQLTLVGYSGGAAVAALLAARRTDVERLVTVAGNLDHRAWTTHHRISPLTDSLNAGDAAHQLRAIPQTHFFGSLDKIIPPALALNLPSELRGQGNRHLQFMPDHDHQCCWVQDWPRLWALLP